MAKVPVAAIGAGKKISWSCQFDCILFPRTIFNFKFIYIYIYSPVANNRIEKKKIEENYLYFLDFWNPKKNSTFRPFKHLFIIFINNIK